MPFQPGHCIGAAQRWKPGQSGNPKGRSKLDFDLAAAARAHSPEMLGIAVAIARDETVPPESRLRAVEIILSRGHGKPIAAHLIEQRVEQASPTDIWIQVLREYSERRAVDPPPVALPGKEG